MPIITLPLKCPGCDCSTFEGPNDPVASDIIKCTGCGNSLTYSELVAVNQRTHEKEIERQAKKEMDKIVKDFAKKNKRRR